MPTKSLRDFIREHRAELDDHIKGRLGRPSMTLSDEGRREWILNDEDLYNWARREGVRI